MSTLQTRAVAARLPADEEARLAELHSYAILDTAPEVEFDAIASLAAEICGTPIARVNLVDRTRQWAKATVGIEGGDTPRDEAFCPHTIVSPEGVLVVEDTLDDSRFAQSPLVHGDPGIRFYAGSAIQSGSGRPVGAVCVVDTEPRRLSDAQLEALRNLSRMASTQLELRKLLLRERRLVEELRLLDRQKAEFTSGVAHDFRTPLTSIRGYAELLREEAIEPEIALDAIERGTERLLHLVDDLSGSATAPADESLDLSVLAGATIDLLRAAATADSVSIEAHLRPAPLRGDAHRLAQVLENLIGNAVKYSPGGTVEVSTGVEDGEAVLDVSDTGVGIPADEIPRLFDRFFRASTASGFAGSGIGLATVKSLVEAHGGTIGVDSVVGQGTTVRVCLPAI